MFDCADCQAQTLHRQRAKLGYLMRRVLIGGRTPRRSQHTFGAAGPPRSVGVLRGSYRINYTVTHSIRGTIYYRRYTIYDRPWPIPPTTDLHLPLLARSAHAHAHRYHGEGLRSVVVAAAVPIMHSPRADPSSTPSPTEAPPRVDETTFLVSPLCRARWCPSIPYVIACVCRDHPNPQDAHVDPS
jgi:hypothetical protein